MTPRIPSPFTFLFESAVLALTAALAVVLSIAAPSVAYADEADILAAMDQGEKYINVADMGWTVKSREFDQSFMDEIRNIEGITPCLSHPTSYSRIREGKDKGTVNRLIVSYDCPTKKVHARAEKYWGKVDKIAKKAQKKGTKYEQALYCYETLIKSVKYDQKTADTIGRDQERYTKHASAASALVDGSSICVGYSTALRDLFRAIGLNAIMVETTEHAWTQVELDGLTLTCDATSDDMGDKAATDHFMVKSNGELYRPEIPKKAEKKEASPKPEKKNETGGDTIPAPETPEPAAQEETEQVQASEPEQEAASPMPYSQSYEPKKPLYKQRKQLESEIYDFRWFLLSMQPAERTIYGKLSGVQVSPRRLVVSAEFYYFTETL